MQFLEVGSQVVGNFFGAIGAVVLDDDEFEVEAAG